MKYRREIFGKEKRKRRGAGKLNRMGTRPARINRLKLCKLCPYEPAFLIPSDSSGLREKKKKGGATRHREVRTIFGGTFSGAVTNLPEERRFIKVTAACHADV